MNNADQEQRNRIAEVLAGQLGEIYPWAEGMEPLSSGSFGHAFLLRDGDIAKLRSGRPEDETHEGHNLRCLSRVNDGRVLVPEYRHETRPFEFHEKPCVVTFMSYLDGCDVTKGHDEYYQIGQMIGRLQRLLAKAGGISDGLRVSCEFSKVNEHAVLKDSFKVVSTCFKGRSDVEKLQKVIHSYFDLPPRPSWIHGDVHNGNIIQCGLDYGIIDFGLLHKARHPETELMWVDSEYQPRLIAGYESESEISIDRRLMATLEFMKCVHGAHNAIRRHTVDSDVARRNLKKVSDRLSMPRTFYGEHKPYSL